MTRRARGPAQQRAWLAGDPPLSEVRARYPDEWRTVQRELAEMLSSGGVETVQQYVASVANPAPLAPARPGTDRDGALLAAEVRQYLAAGALKQMCVSAATGVTEGRVRFNLLNGFLAQRLLFVRGLERKPVSLRWFRVMWPVIWQRRFLMPLVEPKGIYCFYSHALIDRLADLIADRRCLEIGAGDGTLARFLNDAGVQVTATDDHSWRKTVTYPAEVLHDDARTALRDHRPQVVLCSWPPAGNEFERAVFATPSVELYVVIASRHEFASGNWTDYRRQATFALAEDPELSRLVLPPELESAVYVFRRIGAE